MATNFSSIRTPSILALFPCRAVPILALSGLGALGLGCDPAPESSGTGGGTSTTTSVTGGGGAGGGTATCSSTETETATGPADPLVLIGTFQVQLNEEKPASNGDPGTPASTSVLGKMYDGAYPAQIVWEVDSFEGDCRLLTPRVPFCSTPCGGTAVCVEDETCQDYPKAHSAGAVTIEGLETTDGATSITMCPIANNYQVPVGTTLKYPAFAGGSPITLQAAGDYFGAFKLATEGIEPLVITSETPHLAPDQSVFLEWEHGAPVQDLMIHVKLDISHHGGTKGMIECDLLDTGGVEIPGVLVTKLLALGVAGYPTVIVTREQKGSSLLPPGRVELVIASIVERTVTIDGLVSCTDTSECPQGQTCQSDLTCK